MKTLKTRGWLWAAVAVLGFALIACGGGSEPQEVTFDIAIADRDLVGETATYVATQGDTVTFNITSDEPGAVHIHGYDVEDTIGENGQTSISFVADATGQFGIEMHVGEHAHGTPPQGEGETEGHAHEGEEATISLGALQVRPR